MLKRLAVPPLLGLVILILFSLATTVAVHAEPPPEEVGITVQAFPTCRVYMDTPTGLSYLGPSGKPLRVAPPLLRDPQGRPVQYAGGVLVLKCDHHGDLRVGVAAQDWLGGRLPSSGRFHLPAASLLVSARDYAAEYPVLGLVLAGVLLAGAWRIRRWRSQARSASAQLQSLSSQLDSRGDPLIGKNIGRYRVEARLGQGGMGAVYRVVCDGGTYAAKVIYLDEQEDSLSLDRFRREFRLLSQLAHPTFPRCFDYLELEGMACVIMELMPGRTLRKYVDPAGLPWSTVWPWIRAILEGLEFAHERGIVHRDLKPENIMIAEGQVKILDFGLARSSQVTALTLTGEALGTPRYLAPEQLDASGTDVDRRTDLYSLGVIIYELLRGAPPFEGRDPGEVLRKHLNQPAPPLDVPGIPPGLAEVVAVLLDKNPANRYASARRVLEVLEGLADAGLEQDTIAVKPLSE